MTEALTPGVTTTIQANIPYALPPGPHRVLFSTASATYSSTVGGVYAALTTPNVEPGVLLDGGFVQNTAGGQRLVIIKKITRLGTYAGLVAQANPLAFWRLNEKTGNTLFDSFGPYNLAKGSGVTLGTAGPLGDGNTAVTLDGTINGQGSTSSGANPWSGQAAISFEAWVFNAAWAATHEMAVSLGSLGIYMSVDTGSLTMSIHTGSQLVNKQITPMTANAWHHIAGTWASGGKIDLFVDGAAVAGDNVTTRVGTLSAGINFFVGSFGGTALFYSGIVDEVAVYLRKLSASEITSHFSARSTKA
jgi:large repetitive protein